MWIFHFEAFWYSVWSWKAFCFVVTPKFERFFCPIIGLKWPYDLPIQWKKQCMKYSQNLLKTSHDILCHLFRWRPLRSNDHQQINIHFGCTFYVFLILLQNHAERNRNIILSRSLSLFTLFLWERGNTIITLYHTTENFLST